MAFPNKLSQFCTPSYVYFIISVLAIAVSAFQNMGNKNKYNLGMFSCRVPVVYPFLLVRLYTYFSGHGY